jgi:hypothetical protein
MHRHMVRTLLSSNDDCDGDDCLIIVDDEVDDDSCKWSLLWGSGCGPNSVGVWVVALFFAIWNAGCSGIIVHPLVRWFYFGWRNALANTSVILLIFPHWYAGLIVPVWIGGIVATSIAIPIPYLRMIWVMSNHARNERDDNAASSAALAKTAARECLREALNAVRAAGHVGDVSLALSRLQAKMHTIEGVQLVGYHLDGGGGDDDDDDRDMWTRVAMGEAPHRAAGSAGEAATTASLRRNIERQLSGEAYWATGIPTAHAEIVPPAPNDPETELEAFPQQHAQRIAQRIAQRADAQHSNTAEQQDQIAPQALANRPRSFDA